MKHRLSILVVTLLAAAGLGACGGASDGAPADGAGERDGRAGADIWVGRDDTGGPADAGDAATDAVADTFPDAIPDVARDAGADSRADTDGPSDVAPDGADALDALAPDALDAADASDARDPDAADAVTPTDIGEIACEEDFDCELALPFRDLCERVWCEEGRCRIAAIEDCCFDDGDCFDWDPCTDDRCSETTRQCENAPVADPACCSGEWLVRAEFEDGLPDGWEVERPDDARAFWHVSGVRAATGRRSLLFVEPESGGYGTGYREQGEARGPWFDVPADAEQPLLGFDLYLDTEWRLYTGPWADPSPLVYDRLDVLLDDGAQRTEIWTSYDPDVRGHTCTNGCAFQRFTVDLRDFRGRRVRPVFRFDSGDNVDNDWSGAAVDNVGVELACGPPPACFASSDCDDGDRCTDDRCDGGVCVHEPNYAAGCCYDYEQASWQFDPFSMSGFQVQPQEPLVRWHVTDRRSSTGAASLRFGSVVNDRYDTPGEPVSGTALSPSAALASWVTTTLTLDVWVDVEPYDPVSPQRDLFEIVVFTPVDGESTVVWSRSQLAPEQYRTWVPLEIPLTDWAGQVVLLRFRFSSGDDEQNDGEGVYVDNVRLTRRCFL